MPRKPVTDTPAVAPPPGPALADWNLLRSFITAHETGTLTEAARLLGSTQPSVGRHVRELEAAVGEALFVRRPGRLEPTQRGHDLYATVAGMKHAVTSAQCLFSGAQERVVGTVRVAASEVYAYHVVTPILAALLGEHPGLEIALSVSNRADNLLRRDADIAVRFFRPEQDDLVAVHVGNTELGLYAHESYLQRFGEPTGFDVPEDAFVAGFDRETAPIGPFLKKPTPAFQLRFRLRTDAMLSRQAAVETGCGIGVFLADVAAERPGLRRVLADRFGQPQQVWLCAHTELRRSASMRVVWERLESRLRARLAA
jgi:DNA-binding transcriptional LysR family regulator